MLSAHFRKIFMILIIGSFASNSFAAWSYNRNATRCTGNNCHHTVVHKNCHNGSCHVWRHTNNWHR